MASSRVAIAIGLSAIPLGAAVLPTTTSLMPGVNPLCYDYADPQLPKPGGANADEVAENRAFLSAEYLRLMTSDIKFSRCTKYVPGGEPFWCAPVYDYSACNTLPAGDQPACKVLAAAQQWHALPVAAKEDFNRCVAALEGPKYSEGRCFKNLVTEAQLQTFKAGLLAGDLKNCDWANQDCKDAIFGHWLANPTLVNVHTEAVKQFAACQAVYNEDARELCTDIVTSHIPAADLTGGDPIERLAAKKYLELDSDVQELVAYCKKWNPAGPQETCYKPNYFTEGQYGELLSKCGDCQCCKRKVLTSFADRQDAAKNKAYQVCNSFFRSDPTEAVPEMICLRWQVRNAIGEPVYDNIELHCGQLAGAVHVDHCLGQALEAKFRTLTPMQRNMILGNCLP